MQLGSRAAKRPCSQASRRPGSQAARQPGSQAVRQPGSQAVRQPASKGLGIPNRACRIETKDDGQVTVIAAQGTYSGLKACLQVEMVYPSAFRMA